MGQKKRKRTHKVSSGLSAKRKAKRTIGKLKLKINRWNRYCEEIRNHKRKGVESRWNISGIEKHIKLLQRFVGAK
jgi:hypothetical protein